MVNEIKKKDIILHHCLKEIARYILLEFKMVLVTSIHRKLNSHYVTLKEHQLNCQLFFNFYVLNLKIIFHKWKNKLCIFINKIGKNIAILLKTLTLRI